MKCKMFTSVPEYKITFIMLTGLLPSPATPCIFSSLFPVMFNQCLCFRDPINLTSKFSSPRPPPPVLTLRHSSRLTNKSTCSNRPIMHCPCFYKISVEFLGKSPQFKDQPAADSCPTEWLPWWWDSHLLHRSPASAGSGFLKVAIRLVVPA